MMRSLTSVAVALALAACSHSAPPPETSSTSTTSAAFSVAPQNRMVVAPAPRHTVAPLRAWAANHPDAAVLFAQWAEGHKQTAVKIAQWGKANPERMKALVEWAPIHVGATVGAFMANRSDSDDLAQIATDDPQGVEGFLDWVRTAPDSADDLANYADGVAYADRHAAEWAHIDAAALGAAERQQAAPAKGPAASDLEQAGAPQIGMRGADAVSNGAPPAKPAEPQPPADQAPTPKPKYPY